MLCVHCLITPGGGHTAVWFSAPFVVACQQVFTLKTVDISAVKKTAEYTAELAIEMVRELQDTCKVYAVVSDAAAGAKKARRLVVGEFPEIVVIDCMAQQIKLLVTGRGTISQPHCRPILSHALLVMSFTFWHAQISVCENTALTGRTWWPKRSLSSSGFAGIACSGCCRPSRSSCTGRPQGCLCQPSPDGAAM